ncbi:MAG TPA: GNAT family N-acetyltransferase [bacterium]|nr:GNAT family N-acetyltransferase [bacterium]
MPPAGTPARVRAASSFDAESLAALAARTMRESYAADHDPAQLERHIRDTVSPERIAEELADRDIAVFVAEDGSGLTGYATLAFGEAPACVTASAPAELGRIYVSRRRFRTGTGSALLTAVLDECVRRGRDVLWLSVWDRNLRALAFYHDRGFRESGTVPFMFGGVEYEDRVLARPVETDGA